MPVHLQQSARDLQDIAKSVVANPTVFKKVRHSGALSPFRRTVQSKGAMASGAASVAKKGVSVAIGFIPLPVLPALLDKAWDKLSEYLKARQRNAHIQSPANLDEKVKFELKTIGEEVANWDNYRWKVQHAVEQFNKAATEATQSMATTPCDTWVRVWAKYYYLGQRMEKLRFSVEAVRAVTEEVDVWLLSVEQSYEEAFGKADVQYKTDVAQLKTGQFHDSCSDNKCMFKSGQYLKQMTVPTSDASKYFIKGVSMAVGSVTDKLSSAVDKATEL